MSASSDWSPPGLVPGAYPDVYTKRPLPPPRTKPGMLSDDKIEQFFRDGFLVVDDFFDCEKELEPCKKAIEEEVDALAHTLLDAGKIDRLYEEYGLFERLQKVEHAFPGACVLLHKRGVLPQAVRDLWSNERLLDVMEQILGPELSGNPVWNLRPKTPSNTIGVVPWHQDNGYYDHKAYGSLVVTGWIPLVDTSAENGCLQVVRGGHRTGRIARHTLDPSSPTLHLCLSDQEMEKTLEVDMARDVVTVPVKYGSFLIFSNATPHSSLPNRTALTRWTLDLRWQATSSPDNFFGLMSKIPFRSAANPDLQIQWGSFDSHLKVQKTEKGKYSTGEVQPDLVPAITGPWVDKWRSPEA